MSRCSLHNIEYETRYTKPEKHAETVCTKCEEELPEPDRLLDWVLNNRVLLFESLGRYYILYEQGTSSRQYPGWFFGRSFMTYKSREPEYFIKPEYAILAAMRKKDAPFTLR